jgi:hypothetical protein
MLCSFASISQVTTAPVNEPNRNKPKLFAGLPDRVDLNTDAIAGLFSTTLGQPASIRLTGDNSVQFHGEVVSSAAASPDVQRMVIRSTNFNGANLSISKITQEDGSVVYKGRIISFAHGDLYILENKDGHYALVKKNFYDLINE